MISFTLRQIADATSARLVAGAPEAHIDRVSTDSRSLKPGDLVVALKLVLCPGDRYESLAEALGMSLSVTHRAVRRLEQARLLILGKRNANRPGLLEFLVYGSS